MKPERIARMAEDAIAFDTETHLIQPGLLAPPMVCGSLAGMEDGAIRGALLDHDDTWHAFLKMINAPEVTLVGANIAYDMLVMAVVGARRGVDLMPAIFDAYDRGSVYDVQIAEALHGIALGMLGMDPRTGQPLVNPETGKRGRYSLATCVDIVLGRSNAKANDRFRLSYALLENTPIEEWPEEARTYPVDDAVNTLEVALAQVGARPASDGPDHPHRWGAGPNGDRCHDCGYEIGFGASPPCTRRGSEPRRNLHNLAAQVYAAWAMHLGASWGFNVDPPSVDALAAKAAYTRETGQEEFVSAGLLKRDKKGETSKDTAAIKRRVASAFGASMTCIECDGTGKVPGKGKTLIGCKPCAATGFDLDTAPNVPRTPTGGVETGRDTLTESGDESLIAFAAFGEQDKIESTYLPWLRSGIREDGTVRPINLRPNVLLDTGRASYGDVVQLLPRNMGIRECIVARPGYVLASIDYGGLELVTHAQSCMWIVGWSKLAEWIKREGASAAHAALGAQLAGCEFEDFKKRMKAERFLKDCRQAAKPANFGFPGGMGAAKLVLQQRKQGPDTLAPSGRVYKGLRFCILMGGELECGTTKVTEYKGRPLPPTCAKCIACAEDLRSKWFATFPENRVYFDHVNKEVERGRIVQHVSQRERGGVEFCAAANGYFQALAADGAKLALCRVAREQYVDRGTALFGSRTILFAHDELVIEMPEDRAHEASHRVSDIMVAAMGEFCPDVPVEAPPALMRRWYKGAEPVYVDGRLVPWEPTGKG